MEFIVTDCADHGTKVVADYASARTYIGFALACAFDAMGRTGTHLAAHLAAGEDCWVCCHNMQIDPQGICD